MIILSVGMPRAGSGWHYNLIHDLMKTTGAVDAGDIRERYRLQGILTEVNNNIGVLSARRLGLVTLPALAGNTFVIKAHAGPTSTSRLLQSLGLLRVTYIYRDPRDAMLSAFEYGQRGLQRGRPNAFSHLKDFQKSLDFIMDYVRIWDKWTKEKNVFITRYEDLQTVYDNEVTRLVKFLKLSGANPEVQKVIESYHQPVLDGQRGLHFNKGKIGRFREAYSAEEQAILQEKMGSYLPRMGYEI
ncbi:MAG TPA: sulfotransferase domain-containing protein [Anaerolineales bacterium]|nr:sulfotransferase domain-containing protein [Anaerolineales bacterium]